MVEINALKDGSYGLLFAYLVLQIGISSMAIPIDYLKLNYDDEKTILPIIYLLLSINDRILHAFGRSKLCTQSQF